MIHLDDLLTLNTSSGDVSISITVEIETALCIGAGGSTGSLADKAIVRNAAGQLLIPGSHLKGRLRHECEKIARSLGWWVSESPTAAKMCFEQVPESFRHQQSYQVDSYPGYHCFISQIFGDPILPSRVIVDDLTCLYSRNELAQVIRPGVSLSRRRQTAEDSKLFFLETSPANARLPFHGEIHLLQGYPIYTQALLACAFAHIHAIGGNKSAGLGWLTWKELPTIASDFDWSDLHPKTV